VRVLYFDRCYVKTRTCTRPVNYSHLCGIIRLQLIWGMTVICFGNCRLVSVSLFLPNFQKVASFSFQKIMTWTKKSKLKVTRIYILHNFWYQNCVFMTRFYPVYLSLPFINTRAVPETYNFKATSFSFSSFWGVGGEFR